MWIDLIIRSFQAKFLLPLNTETTYYAMLGFDTQPELLVLAGGFVGAMLAMVANIVIGAALSRVNMQRNHPQFLKLQAWLTRYFVWVLAIPGLPLVGLLTLLVAAAGVPVRRILIAVVIGQGLAYGITGLLTRNTEILGGLLRLAQ